MVADSMRFVGNTLGLDCVAYTMVQHLCQSHRSFVSDSGLDLERYFILPTALVCIIFIVGQL